MKPMNLMIIMDDEHSQKAMGCYGHPLVKSPLSEAWSASEYLGRTAEPSCYTNTFCRIIKKEENSSAVLFRGRSRT